MTMTNRTSNHKHKIIPALLISLLMCFCLCACGSQDYIEETVEITTPSEETTAAEESATEEEATDGEGEEAASGSEESGNEDLGKYDSQYEKIYSECNAAMKKATAKYVSELEEKSGSVSKSDLYDETQDRIDALKKVYDDGKDKMVKAMLASTEDDAKEYDKYFSKMTEKYTEYTRELTATYTDGF